MGLHKRTRIRVEAGDSIPGLLWYAGRERIRNPRRERKTMKRRLSIAVLGLCLGVPCVAMAQDDAPARKLVKAEPAAIYDETADAEQQIADALASAKKENRRVLIQWGANWCGWCHKLHDTMKKDAGLRKKLMYEYDVVLIDIGQFNKNLDLAEKYRADIKGEGVPYLTILDADGKVLLNHETGSLEASDDPKASHNAPKIVELLTKYQAPYKEAMTLYEAALAQAKAEDKKVFMHFGAPWCGWCHRLEDWMAREDVASILGDNYVDLKIDVDRTAGESGDDLLKRYNAGKGSGIPWFVMLDETGKALIDSNGPDGNIGYPTAEEPVGIAHLMRMFKESAPRMTDEQIAYLKSTLEAKPKAPAEAADGAEKAIQATKLRRKD
jgi:thioredoxin-related protein